MKIIGYAVSGMLFAFCASAADTGPLALELAVLNSTVSSQVKVRVTTTNDSDHPITYSNTNRCNYSFRVIAATGRAVPETEERKQLHCGSQVGLEISGRRILVTLKPSESSSEELRLMDFNDVSQPGEYSVQVDRTFPGIGHFSSSPIKIDVQP